MEHIDLIGAVICLIVALFDFLLVLMGVYTDWKNGEASLANLVLILLLGASSVCAGYVCYLLYLRWLV